MRAKGNQLPHARLTPEKVREIRQNREGLTDKDRARKLGVHENSITRARTGETWGHV